MNIYVDMDDVVADWMAAAQARLNRNWNYGQRIPDTDWQKIKEDERFYLNLPIKAGAYNLIDWCQRYCLRTGSGLYFLTALPHDYSMPWAAQDKVHWANKHFPGVPVFLGPFSHDKWRHCKPGDVLIDDRASNCTEWISAGGQAHIYRSWDECEKWLKETLK